MKALTTIAVITAGLDVYFSPGVNVCSTLKALSVMCCICWYIILSAVVPYHLLTNARTATTSSAAAIL